jgi:hypothetical protein
VPADDESLLAVGNLPYSCERCDIASEVVVAAAAAVGVVVLATVDALSASAELADRRRLLNRTAHAINRAMSNAPPTPPAIPAINGMSSGAPVSVLSASSSAVVDESEAVRFCVNVPLLVFVAVVLTTAIVAMEEVEATVVVGADGTIAGSTTVVPIPAVVVLVVVPGNGDDDDVDCVEVVGVVVVVVAPVVVVVGTVTVGDGMHDDAPAGETYPNSHDKQTPFVPLLL